MSSFLLGAALVIGATLTVALHRVWAGPTIYDRLVAVSLVTANTLVMLVLVASYYERIDMVVDIALGYALLTFTLPIAIAKHLESRRADATRGPVRDALSGATSDPPDDEGGGS